MTKRKFSRPRSGSAALATACLALAPLTAAAQIAFQDVSGAAGFAGTATESWGASWGDVDGDSYPDLFFSNHRNRATLYRNGRDGTFSEVSRQVDASGTAGWTGGRATVDTHGVTWADVDNDGDDDLLQTVESNPEFLHLNVDGRLYDRTAALGVDRLGGWGSRQALFLDADGDGRLDLASIELTRPMLSRQLDGGAFGSGSGSLWPLACASEGQWGHLADIHPAGGLELVCAQRNGTYPKVNSFSGGTVRDVTASFRQYSAVIDAATLDFNRDQRPDVLMLRGTERPSDVFQSAPARFEAQLITARGTRKSVSFRTGGVLTLTVSIEAGVPPQGDPAYVDVGAAAWSPTGLTFQLDPSDSRTWGIASGSPGLNIGYFPATGEWRIVSDGNQFAYAYLQVQSTASITNLAVQGATEADRGYRPVLMRNTGNGLEPVTGIGLDAVLRCQSVVSGDFDNDMDEDLFMACTGGTRNLANRLFENRGGRFVEIAGAGGAAGRTGAAVASGAGTSESVVVADYDRDGFLDLLVTNGNNMRPVYAGGPTQLFRNRGNANHWLQLDLVGTQSNRAGVGARVQVAAGGVTQYREQNGGYHRWSQNFRRLHVGLGGSVRADVRVEWPDGSVTTHPALDADRLHRLRQDGTSSVVPR
jgi:hypothetical protein